MRLKKAAMFGLDARIALAIFGTVSIISTASIIQVIGTSKLQKIVFEMKELDKAIAAYELDTDSTLPIISAGVFNIGELKSSVKAGWKKPYIGHKQVSGADANRYFVSASLGRFSVFQGNDRATADNASSPFNQCTDAAKTCYAWVLFDSSVEGKVPTEYMNGLDKMLDDGDGFLTGRIQKYNNDGLLYRLSIRDYTP